MLPSPLRSLLLNVGLGFATVLALMLAVLSLSVKQMSDINNQLERVVSVNNVKTQLASRMRDTLRDRAVLMHSIVVSIDPWEQDRLFISFLEHGERYAKDRAAIIPLLESPEEIALLDKINGITAVNQPVMYNVIDQALNANNYGALVQLQEEAIPLQDKLVDALDRMSLLQRKASEHALGETYAAHGETRRLMLLLGLSATLLALFVAALVSRRLLRQTRALNVEKQKYQTLFETNSDAVVILDDRGFTDCNPAALSMFGMNSVAEFLATPIPQLGDAVQPNGLPAYEHAMNNIARARESGHAQMDWRARRADGTLFESEIFLHAMQLEGQPVIQAIMRDVSERRAAEAAREAVREAALQMARAKSAFVANVSHEIRTPMHGILGMASLLQKTPLDPRQLDYVGTLKSSAESLLAIINDILDFSKIEAGKLDIEQIAFSPGDLVHDVVALFSARMLDKDIELKLSVDPSTPEALLGDPVRIRQILLNLVDNAIKFTDHGTVELHAEFEPGDEAIACRFHVCDTGIGISPETQARLFQAFTQADATTTRRYGGTGLGLAVSGQLAELMGGSITVQSIPGAGSCFTLSLRLPATTLPLAELPGNTATRLSGNVLMVEDHPVNQKVLAHQLAHLGVTSTLATQGAEALDKLSTASFDLILMDWQMPEMDGLEATRRIRALPGAAGRVPIIALTANASSGFRETCLAAGANDYLAKPYSEAALAEVLAQWLPVDESSPEPLFDPGHLAARYPGNTTLSDELAHMFVQTTADSLATLNAALARKDMHAIRREAHALRGAAASIGAVRIAEHAGQLETLVAEGDLTQAAEALDALDRLFRRAYPRTH